MTRHLKSRNNNTLITEQLVKLIVLRLVKIESSLIVQYLYDKISLLSDKINEVLSFFTLILQRATVPMYRETVGSNCQGKKNC